MPMRRRQRTRQNNFPLPPTTAATRFVTVPSPRYHERRIEHVWHDSLGRLKVRSTAMFPKTMPTDEIVEGALASAMTVEDFAYVLIGLDNGDNPPPWRIQKDTRVYEMVNGQSSLESHTVEYLSAYDAQRAEAQRRDAERVAEQDAIARQRQLLPMPTPQPPPVPAFPPPPTARVATNERVVQRSVRPNFEFDTDFEAETSVLRVADFRALMATAVFSTVPDTLTPRYVVEADAARDALIRSREARCSLEKGCTGFCAVCKRCSIHCTCAKSSEPTPPRKIHLEP